MAVLSCRAVRGARGRVVVGLAMTVVASLPAFLTGALGVELRADLHLSLTALGGAVSVFFAVSALCSAPLGRLGQRLGAGRALRLGAVLAAASLLGVGAGVHSLGALLVCMAVGGAGNGLTQPSVNAFMSRGMPATRLGLAFGIKQSAIPVAILLSGVSVPALALTVGWRTVFLVAGAVALAAALAAGRLTGAGGGERRRAGRPASPTLLLAALAVGASLASAPCNALGAFLVSSAVHSGISQATAGIVLALASGASVVVRIVSGAVVDRRHSEGLRPFTLMLVGGSLGFAGLAVSSPATTVAAAIVAFGAGWGWGGVFNFAVVSRNRDAPAVATGITQTGVYFGAAAGPVLFGALAATSYDVAWLTMAGLALGSAAIATAVRRALPAAEGAPPAADALDA